MHVSPIYSLKATVWMTLFFRLMSVNKSKQWVGFYPAGEEQSSAVGCCVVCQPHSDAILGELMRVRGTHNHVSFDLGVGNLQQKQAKNHLHTPL